MYAYMICGHFINKGSWHVINYAFSSANPRWSYIIIFSQFESNIRVEIFPPSYKKLLFSLLFVSVATSLARKYFHLSSPTYTGSQSPQNRLKEKRRWKSHRIESIGFSLPLFFRYIMLMFFSFIISIYSIGLTTITFWHSIVPWLNNMRSWLF